MRRVNRIVQPLTHFSTSRQRRAIRKGQQSTIGEFLSLQTKRSAGRAIVRMSTSPIPIRTPLRREASTQLNIIIVGAGLGGVGAAIALLLAGHKVTILEAASEIAEVGAGIQLLPNSSRVVQSWGMRERLEKHATKPSRINILGWKGNLISHMDFHESASAYPGTFYWDFHPANLHKCLLERAVELGAEIKVQSRVVDVRIAGVDAETATVVLETGDE